ncbi:M35 family metallo-endopeptidase [Kitasatospora sp. NPDC059146]|uniref:M35 family metallo-endopeptidase n=1 Tax=unclassified Kitasatospora TaxID=2633591 RepID=UPI0036BA4CE5
MTSPDSSRFVAMSTAEQKAVTTAAASAHANVEATYSYLQGLQRTSPRFKEWFGTPDATSAKTVSGVILRLAGGGSGLSTIPDFTFRREPENKIQDGQARIGTVSPDTYGEVGLYPYFFTLPPLLQAGALVSLATQFTSTGATATLAYDEGACKMLAAKDPKEALRNADSYRHFVMNSTNLN